MSINLVLSSMLLALIGLPLLTALLLRLLNAGKAARNLAVYSSALHLLITISLLVLSTGFFIEDLSASGAVSDAARTGGSFQFQPVAVPGDPGNPGTGNDGFTHSTNWTMTELGGLKSQFYIGLDGLNAALIVLSSLMVFIAVLLSWDYIVDRPAGYYAWLFILQAVTIGAFTSFDLLLFYIFFELTLIPSFFLIGSWGTGSGRRDAARKFVLYTLFGSLFTLVGLIGVVLMNPAPVDPVTKSPMYNDPNQVALSPQDQDGPYRMRERGAFTFSIPTLMKNASIWDTAHNYAVAQAKHRYNIAKPGEINARGRELEDAENAQRERRSLNFWLFLAIMAGFVVKIPLVPFHTWLPAAYGEAPLPITMLFSALLAKLGTYGIIRIVIPILPDPCVQYGLLWFGVLGAIGVVYAGFCAYAQRDLKMIAAYSSVSHLGFLTMGLFAMTVESLTGAVLHMVNHGLTAGAMFATLVFLSKRYRTTDANAFGGLMAKYPKYTFFTMVLVLASVGVPGFNNFVSEMLLLSGLLETRNTKQVGSLAIAAVGAFGILISSWYMMTMVRRVFFGATLEPPTPEETPRTDVTSRELVPLSLLSALCLFLGLFPQPLITGISSDADRVASITERARYRLDSKVQVRLPALREPKVDPNAPPPQLVPAGAAPGGGLGPRGVGGPRGPGGPPPGPGGRGPGGPPGGLGGGRGAGGPGVGGPGATGLVIPPGQQQPAPMRPSAELARPSTPSTPAPKQPNEKK